MDGHFEVPAAALGVRALVTFAHPTRTELLLADLTGESLKGLGLNNDISAGDDYAIPQQWAAAIHGARPDLDGIRYVSRQNNSSFCYAVFDRCGLRRGGFAPIPERAMMALCRRFKVHPVY